MVYMLRLKDGHVIRGTMVGEVGDSLLFRRENNPSDIRVIHISELSAAWEVKGEESKIDTHPTQRPKEKVTYDDEFRLIEPEEVDSLLDQRNHNLNNEHPPPEFYYEVSIRTDRIIVTCDVAETKIDDIIVDVRNGTMSIFFKMGGLTRQISYGVNGIMKGEPKWSWNDSVLDIVVPLERNI